MSSGRYRFEDAYTAAALLCANLAPFCARLAIAGSVRRLISAHHNNPARVPAQTRVGDVEVVAVAGGELLDYVRRAYSLWSDSSPNGTKHKKLAIPRVGVYSWDHDKHLPCDLFITTEAQWGYIYALRTGPHAANMAWATPRAKGGRVRPDTILLRGGYVYKDVGGMFEPLPTPTEAAFFGALGLPLLPPHERSAASFEQYAATP